VRFLGRKVYVAALVVIASVLGRQQALVGRGAPRHVQGVPARTVRRWLAFWSITFVLTTFWAEAKAFLASPVEEAMLPGSLLARFGVTTEAATLTRMLRWIAPITTASVRAEIVMAG
jgi:hypothetical protein